MSLVHRHHACPVQCVEEKLPVDRYVLLAALRNHLAVVRISVVHQLRVDDDAGEVEAYLALLDHDGRLSVGCERTLQFGDGLRGKHYVLLGHLRKLQLLLDEREAPSVSRYHRELLVLETHQNALEHPARVVLRGGVRGLA